MTDEYTPTAESVRDAYCHLQQTVLGERGHPAHERFHAEFDRWLEAHDREVAARAWDEGFTRGFYSGQAMRSDADASESPVENPYDADRIEQGGDDE